MYTVGQIVGIVRLSDRQRASLEGKFVVVKVNKVRAHLARICDGAVRTFSVTTFRELGAGASRDTFTTSERSYEQYEEWFSC